ncbi:MAG: CHAT domain-containing protein [Bacteroidales bacterium]|nr:CHAT domain-containing protein [Bacteroidales bacterium]
MKLWIKPPSKVSGHLICFAFCVFLFLFPEATTAENNDVPAALNGDFYIKKGDSLAFYAQYEKALKMYELAAEKFLADGHYSGYVMTLNRMTGLWIEKDLWQPAIKCNLTASDTAAKYLSPTDPERIYTIINRGRIKSEEGYSEEALSIFRKALVCLHDAGLPDHHYTAVTSHCLAQEYDHNWDFSRAVCYYHMALHIDRKLFPEDHPVIARHLAELGESCIYNFEPEEALKNIRKSLRIHLQYFGENHPWTGKVYGDLANYYFYVREKDSMLFYSGKALSILSDLLQENHLFISIIHQRLAYQYELKGLVQPAIANMKESIHILESRDIVGHRRLAWAYIWMQKIFYRASLTKPEQNSVRAKCYLDSAYYSIFKGIQAIKPGFTDSSRFACPNAENLIFDRYLINLMTNKILLLLNSIKMCHDKRYLETMLKCTAVLNEIYQAQINKRNIRKGREDIASEICAYLGYSVHFAIELYQSSDGNEYMDEAFMLSEENKSYLLASLLARSDAVRSEFLPDSISRADSHLRNGIKKLESEIYHEKFEINNPDSVRLSSFYIELCHVLEDYDHLISEVEIEGPVSKKGDKTIKVTSFNDLREALNDSTAMAVYDVIDFQGIGIWQIVIYYITKDTMVVENVPLTKDLYSAIESYRNFLIHDTDGEDVDNEEFVDAAVLLYKTLIEPGLPVIKEKDLIIVPDEILCHIPFEAFISELPRPGTPFNKMPWLIRERSVSYAHSATVYCNTIDKKRNIDTENALLAMAPATTEHWKDHDKLITDWIARGEDLGQLKESKNEVEAIGKIFRGMVWTGYQATELEFKKEAGNYEIIHIATHGIVDDAFPMSSKLVFAKDENGEEDGYLNVYELYAMELHAELAVLSACNTGYGKIQNGEGVISLARGFAYAGVPSVVMSLWKVKDRSTSILMQKFYAHLKAGKTKDKALQLAKLEYLEGADPFFSHPHFWAGFVHIGNNSALQTGRESPVAWWLAGIAALIMILATGILYFRYYPERRGRIKHSSSQD